MYAHVQFVQDSERFTTHTTNIKKFPANNKYNANETYKVLYTDNSYYKAFIIGIGETEQDAIEEANRQRVRLPNKKYLSLNETTDTDTESQDEPLSSKRDNKRLAVAEEKIKTQAITAHNFDRILTKNSHEKAATKDVLEENLKQSQKVNSELSKKNRELERRIAEQERKYTELERRTAELESLNVRLQKDVIEKMSGLDLLLNNKDLNKDISNNQKSHSIAARINGQVHLGRDVWLPTQIFDSIMGLAPRKDGLFIKEMATAIYGEDVLITSSVTGTSDNRFKRSSKPALDATKRMAICDILRYRLEERGLSNEDVANTLKKVNSKIAEKIQDLRKGRRRPERVTHTAESDSESNQNERDDEDAAANLVEEVKAAEEALNVN